jgi:hypothetical protein
MLILFALTTHGQSPVTSISASYQTQPATIGSYIATPIGSGAFGGCNTTSYTYTFSNTGSNQYVLNSFNAAGSSWLAVPTGAAKVRLRRIDNSSVTGSRNIVYMETTALSAIACPLGIPLAFKPSYADSMEVLLAGGVLNQGTDNLFTNASNGDGNNNNIERVDVIFSGGLSTSSPTQAGFAIFDRGANNQHDPFRIAAITSLDANGDPNGFGAVRTCTGGNGSNNGGWGHPSTAQGNKQFACYVLRKDVTDTRLRASSNVNQEIGGVFYTFADLGISAGQPLYGYALLGPDGAASPTTAQLLNLANASVYPTTTTEAAGGGLDLVAVNSVFATGGYVVLPASIISFTGEVKDGQTLLKWQTSDRMNATVSLQRSSDGVSYQTIYSPATGDSFTDRTMPAGTSYYRLVIATFGQSSYSQILTLHQNPGAEAWKVFPTVLEKGQTVTIEGLTDGHYTVSFFNTSGSCRRTTTSVFNGRARFGLPGNTLPAGIYWLSVSTAGQQLPGNGKIFIR